MSNYYEGSEEIEKELERLLLEHGASEKEVTEVTNQLDKEQSKVDTFEEHPPADAPQEIGAGAELKSRATGIGEKAKQIFSEPSRGSIRQRAREIKPKIKSGVEQVLRGTEQYASDRGAMTRGNQLEYEMMLRQELARAEAKREHQRRGGPVSTGRTRKTYYAGRQGYCSIPPVKKPPRWSGRGVNIFRDSREQEARRKASANARRQYQRAGGATNTAGRPTVVRNFRPHKIGRNGRVIR